MNHDTSKTNALRAITTAEHQKRFLDSYATCGNVSTAAKEAGIDRNTPYSWLDSEDDTFKIAYRRAKVAYVDMLKQMVNERLKHPLKGTGSDILLIGALNAYAPEEWKRGERRDDPAVETILEVRKRFKELRSQAKVETELTLIERRRLPQHNVGEASAPPS